LENKLTFINGDDWEGVFINGVLKYEGHNISIWKFAEIAQEYNTLNFEFLLINEDGLEWLSDVGSFPTKFTEIPRQFIEKDGD